MNDVLAEIEAVIHANAVDLGEEPTIGVRQLRDGRVRVYDLAVGWRRRPYREYPTAQSALRAAREARANAQKVRQHIASGMPAGEAVMRVTGHYYR